MQAEFVLDYFIVDFFVQLAVIQENCIHFFQFFDDEVAFGDHGFDGDAATDEHLIDSDKLGKFFVIDHLFESLYLIFQADH